MTLWCRSREVPATPWRNTRRRDQAHSGSRCLASSLRNKARYIWLRIWRHGMLVGLTIRVLLWKGKTPRRWSRVRREEFWLAVWQGSLLEDWWSLGSAGVCLRCWSSDPRQLLSWCPRPSRSKVWSLTHSLGALALVHISKETHPPLKPSMSTLL